MEKAWFNQHLECALPKCWSKYTTAGACKKMNIPGLRFCKKSSVNSGFNFGWGCEACSFGLDFALTNSFSFLPLIIQKRFWTAFYAIVKITFAQSESEIRSFEIRKHFKCGLFEGHISNGLVFKWFLTKRLGFRISDSNRNLDHLQSNLILKQYLQ